MEYKISLEINCEEPWFSLVEKGIKPVEGRKGKKKYKDLRPGDLICFRATDDPNRSFVAIVEKIERYQSVLDYLQSVTLEKALPGIHRIDEGLAIYFQWSSLKEIEELGFLGIWIKPAHSAAELGFFPAPQSLESNG